MGAFAYDLGGRGFPPCSINPDRWRQGADVETLIHTGWVPGSIGMVGHRDEVEPEEGKGERVVIAPSESALATFIVEIGGGA